MMLKLSSKASMVGMRIRLSVAMVRIGYVDRIRSTDRISRWSFRLFTYRIDRLTLLITRVDGACERVRLETLVHNDPSVWQNAIFDWGVFSFPASASVGLVGGVLVDPTTKNTKIDLMEGCFERSP